jgi:hypothetical protein
VRTSAGVLLEVPEGWELLEPGDAGLTRRVKAAGPTWTVKEKRGRREFSRGVWAPGATITACRAAVEATRATPEYQRKLEGDRKRRTRKHEEYAAEFEGEVRDFLRFHERYSDLGRRVAGAIARLATPVGSGTVARTERIPIERRAEAATIAWLRHQTTAYDSMHIQRVKGRRREVRRELAQKSRRLLEGYRAGRDVVGVCVLEAALSEVEGDVRPPKEARRPVGSTPALAVAGEAGPEAAAVVSEPAPPAAAPRPPAPRPAKPSRSADDLDAERAATQARILARFKR